LEFCLIIEASGSQDALALRFNKRPLSEGRLREDEEGGIFSAWSLESK